MIKLMVSLLAPASLKNGFSATQSFLAGKKTYLAGSVLLLQAALMLVNQFCALHGLGDLAVWAQGLATNDAVLKGAEALALMGLRAGIAKGAVPAADPSADAVPKA